MSAVSAHSIVPRIRSWHGEWNPVSHLNLALRALDTDFTSGFTDVREPNPDSTKGMHNCLGLQNFIFPSQLTLFCQTTLLMVMVRRMEHCPALEVVLSSARCRFSSGSRRIASLLHNYLERQDFFYLSW